MSTRDGVWILLAFVSACSPPVAPALAPKSEPARPCGKAPTGERRLVRFQHTARHDSQALDPGRYRFELTHGSYEAACELHLSGAAARQTGRATWNATCEGDDLEIASISERIFGLLVPEHLSSVRVRVTRDRAVVLDEVVTAISRCDTAMDAPGVVEPVAGPGELCLSFSSERWQAAGKNEPDCRRRFGGEPQQELHFARSDESSYGLGHGEYRFELEGERYSAACDVIVPIASHGSGEVEVRCDGDELGFWTGVEGILYLHLPARLRSVRARVTRGRSVIFDGVAAGAEACASASLGPEELCLYLAPDSTLHDPSSDSHQ